MNKKILILIALGLIIIGFGLTIVHQNKNNVADETDVDAINETLNKNDYTVFSNEEVQIKK